MSYRPSARSALLIAAAVAALSSTGRAQNPSSRGGTVGPGISSRFVPANIMERMREQADLPEANLLVTAPIESVWTAYRAALEALEVPVTFSEKAAWQMGTTQTKLYRRMGKQPLSNYFRCGEGSIGPNADSYAVYVSLLAVLGAEPDGQVGVHTLIAAQAVDLAGGRNDAIDCTSTGRLELRVANDVKRRLADLK